VDFNLLEAFVVAVAVYGALRVEIAYRRWSARRNWKPNPSHTVSGVKAKGMTENAVDGIKCGNCGLMVKDFVAYDDGDKWCPSCDATEEG
jgi:hypothetical protein